MNERELTPLPDDVTAALAAERARPAVDAVTRARLRTRLRAGLAAGAGVATPEAASELGVLRRVHPGLTAAVGFAVGVATGVAGYSLMRPPKVERVTVVERVEVPNLATRVVASAVAPEPEPPRSVQPTPLPAPSGSTLTAERALLDVAHSALANGNAASALDALSRHARGFPQGVYREEREALAVQALRAAGRTEEAERRAAAFKTRYPRSLFLSTVAGPSWSNP